MALAFFAIYVIWGSTFLAVRIAVKHIPPLRAAGIRFSAFVWLLERVPATRVSTHAYINPVVALGLGVWLGGEQIGWRTVTAAALILASVIAILRSKPRSR